MQLLHENKGFPVALKDTSKDTNLSIKDTPSSNCEVKEKSSNSSVKMNPVASGDNVTTRPSSAHKLKEELPPLVPCCEGKQLQINEDVVRSGLSAISVKHDGVIQCLSMSRACERMPLPLGYVKHRNSFRCLHRPDLKRVPYLRRMTPDELETLFRGFADLPNSVRHNSKENPDAHARHQVPHVENSRPKEPHYKKNADVSDAGNPLHAIPEIRRGSEDLPAGMRLHGARARLYTSVLAGAKAGDQLDGTSANEEYDSQVPDVVLPEDEVQLHEELQIILPPKCDDVTAESSLAPSTDTLSNQQ